MNEYIELVLNGLFTGLGVVLGQHIYELYLKVHINRTREIVNNVEKKVKA